MKSQTVKLPAFLASALVNGDTSGLVCRCAAKEQHSDKRIRWDDPATWKLKHTGDCDFRWLAAALAYVEPGEVVGTADCECDCGAEEGAEHTEECASNESSNSYFSWHNDLPGFDLGADVCDFTVLYPEGTNNEAAPD